MEKNLIPTEYCIAMVTVTMVTVTKQLELRSLSDIQTEEETIR